MPVPIPGLKGRSDTRKVNFLMIYGRPKTTIFRRFRGVPGWAPLATNHAEEGSHTSELCASVIRSAPYR
jgi:hypothetical protein